VTLELDLRHAPLPAQCAFLRAQEKELISLFSSPCAFFAHSFAKSENQMPCFQSLAHDFVEMGDISAQSQEIT
jgi:hypothetical protein